MLCSRPPHSVLTINIKLHWIDTFHSPDKNFIAFQLGIRKSVGVIQMSGRKTEGTLSGVQVSVVVRTSQSSRTPFYKWHNHPTGSFDRAIGDLSLGAERGIAIRDRLQIATILRRWVLDTRGNKKFNTCLNSPNHYVM